ncbi:MAG: VWA domain-containing protein [Acidobacteria bacterium]|nr:VWA domain-containing protein [Acidobacteriota bacterium]
MSLTTSRIITASLVAAAIAAAQTADPAADFTFRVETKLVQIEVRAHGEGGKPVSDLSREDFILEENGKRQKIATFEYVGVPGTLTAGEAAPPSGQAPQPTDKPQPTPAGVAAGPPVRIFILTEAQIAEQSFLYQGIRKFIEHQIPPGTLVSLGTRPFTADRENLLETLDEMAAHPFGRKDSESGDWLSGFYDETTVELGKLERDRLNTVREAREGGSLLGEERYNNHDGNHPNIEMRPPRLRSIDQRIRLLGRQKLRDYLGLVRRLGSYPGKKIVVLFRSGLRLEAENMDLMEPIASEALRNRVSFYTIDSRGLETWIVNATMGVHPGRLMDDEGTQSTRMPIVREIRHRGQDSQYGLRALADHTGGRAVKNTNDLNDIFEVVVPDVYEYYLLGYYPRDDRQRGRFRKIEVRSKRRGIRVETGRGYFEPVQFTQMSEREKSAHLNQAVLADSYASELPIRVGHDFFRADDGQPVVVFGVSAPFAELVTRSAKGNDRVEFTVAARAERIDDGASWIYRSAGYRHESVAADSQAAEPGGGVFVDFTGQIPVPPGKYRWIVLIRNDADGRIGRYDGMLTVPDLSDGFTSSTLLLAGTVSKPAAGKVKKKRSKKNTGIDSVLEFQQRQLHPEYRGEFHQGQQIFFLYDLYNLQPEDISTPPPIRVVLRNGGRDVEEFSAVGDLESRSERRQVRYLGAIDTSSLQPGSYRLSTYFPGESSGQPLVLSREFRVTAQASPR